jgi:copper chaperone
MQEKGETMTETTLRVPDMSCGHCKAAVEGELNKLSGVERADADFGSGTVAVSYDEAAVTTEDLKGAIEEAGYTVAA